MKKIEDGLADLLLEFVTEYFVEFERYAAVNGFDDEMVMDAVNALKGEEND
ncbi:hypothetical protein [Neisseria weaveri]|uniref:hypothetical protein n=1 Tax=Neisseria weaveri TaxID=28091 RepID=UPI0007C9A2D6|nr:hypothetical protein [Neisseria weaveri]SAY50921.1 Uncharacterised protein [Neisseria weaveri]